MDQWSVQVDWVKWECSLKMGYYTRGSCILMRWLYSFDLMNGLGDIGIIQVSNVIPWQLFMRISLKVIILEFLHRLQSIPDKIGKEQELYHLLPSTCDVSSGWCWFLHIAKVTSQTHQHNGVFPRCVNGPREVKSTASPEEMSVISRITTKWVTRVSHYQSGDDTILGKGPCFV